MRIDDLRVFATLAIFAGGLAPRADAVELQAVRYFTAPDHTRIVMDLSGLPTTFRHITLENPPRVVVDVEQSRFVFATTPIPVGDGIVKQIRFGAPTRSSPCRLIVDLQQPSQYDVFLLERVEDKPHRLVVDVRRPGGAPPVVTPSSPSSSSSPSSQAAPTSPILNAPRVERRIGPNTVGDFVIMIDPGHGGDDPGRRNRDGLKEKNLSLDYSKALVAELDRRPGYRALLTRTGDYFVALGTRRAIAESKGAHLFVSMHFNAAPSTKARGTEVFFVSLKGADDRATRELEEAENSADLLGGLPPTDTGSSEDIARMLVDLRQSDSVERSQQLAVRINDELGGVRGVRTRPVKQASFAVLKQLFIPAALVEVGFLTNKEDVKWVKSKANRDAFVRGVADGIIQYCEEVEVPRLGWRIHTVARGESLQQIATSYGMDADSLRAANGLRGDIVRPGQRLRVKRT